MALSLICVTALLDLPECETVTPPLVTESLSIVPPVTVSVVVITVPFLVIVTVNVVVFVPGIVKVFVAVRVAPFGKIRLVIVDVVPLISVL
jgi:hypothetical protein